MNRWTDGALGERPGAPAAAAAATAALAGGRAGASAPFTVYVDEQFANQEKKVWSGNSEFAACNL